MFVRDECPTCVRKLTFVCSYFCLNSLARSAELLTSIHAQVPPPPDAVLAHFDLDALLDSTASPMPTSSPSTLLPVAAATHEQPALDASPQSSAMTAAAAAAEAACGALHTEALAEAVRQDPDASLHAELYHMLALCEPDVFERLTQDDLIQQQGHEQIIEYLQLTRFDLCYHPWRYESWERVLSESLLSVLPCLLFAVLPCLLFSALPCLLFSVLPSLLLSVLPCLLLSVLSCCSSLVCCQVSCMPTATQGHDVTPSPEAADAECYA